MEKYDEVLVQKPIRTTGTIAPGSHYNEKGYKYGRSRDWGDVSPEVQRQVIDALVAAGKKAGLTDHDIASVLAIVRYESGFNPDSANKSGSAAGLGQFKDETRKQYGVHTVFDITANAEAVIQCYTKSKSLAIQYRPGAPQQELDRWTYGFYHDGPGGYDYGGNEIFSRPNGVEQWIVPMEKSLGNPTGNQHLRSSDLMGESGRLSAGTGPTSGPFVQGLPGTRNVLLGPIDSGTPGQYGPATSRNLPAEPPQSDLLSLLDPASRYAYRNALAGTENQTFPGHAAFVPTNAFGPPPSPFSPRPANILAQPFEELFGGTPPITSPPPTERARSATTSAKPFYSLKDKLNFLGGVYPVAKRASEATGLSLPFILAHASHETGWGKNVSGNNLFNLRADEKWQGPAITKGNATYRAYPSYEESVNDYLGHLQDDPRFGKMFEPATRGSVERLANAIHYAGYPDDPLYRMRIVAAAQDPLMKWALGQYDRRPPG